MTGDNAPPPDGWTAEARCCPFEACDVCANAVEGVSDDEVREVALANAERWRDALTILARSEAQGFGTYPLPERFELGEN